MKNLNCPSLTRFVFAFRFNNVEHLPFFILKSNDNFCPKKITLTTEDNKVFVREITNSRLKLWMPMFHDSNINFILQELESIKCPENTTLEGRKESCPKENVRFLPSKKTDERYCAFNPDCDLVYSDDPKAKDSGYICYKTPRATYTNYGLCCDKGPMGALPSC